MAAKYQTMNGSQLSQLVHDIAIEAITAEDASDALLTIGDLLGVTSNGNLDQVAPLDPRVDVIWEGGVMYLTKPAIRAAAPTAPTDRDGKPAKVSRYMVEIIHPNATTSRYFIARDVALAFLTAAYIRYPDLVVTEIDPNGEEWFSATTRSLLEPGESS